MDFFNQTGKMAIGSRLRMLTDKITNDAELIYGMYGVDIRPKWFSVFFVLSRGGAKTITAIAREIGHSHPSVSNIVKEMGARGLVKETRDKSDGRRNMVTLSSKGKKMAGIMAECYPDVESAVEQIARQARNDLWRAIEEWEDQFNEADTDYDSRFLEWGAQWKEVLNAITASVSNINMKLTHEQKEIFNFHFARVFGRASAIHGNQMKSAVTRIAINIFRIISIIALLRSLESLLPGGERSGEPQENIVRTLLDCPGLTPSAHIPQENIADGIVPQFNLSIRTDDFYAVLALVEPLYRHACHILSLLPAGTPTAPSANMTPETLFDCLPLRFTRNEAIDKGEQVGVPAGSVDSLLKRMTERGQLVKVGRGEYEFNARMHTRTCVGVRESASSASLQDS